MSKFIFTTLAIITMTILIASVFMNATYTNQLYNFIGGFGLLILIFLVVPGLAYLGHKLTDIIVDVFDIED